jgi:Fe-S oxidoreductase
MTDESVDKSRDERYRPYRTDLGRDFFSLLREARGFSYVDALDSGTSVGADGADDVGGGGAGNEGPSSLFWPGCTLSSYSKELTEAVFAFLKGKDRTCGMSVKCCGNIIRYAAGRTAYVTYGERLASELEEKGIKRIVTACPNCYRSFKELSQRELDIEVISLSQTLADEGLRVMPNPADSAEPSTPFCIHDSCPDRSCGIEAAVVRRLCEGVELREMKHNRSHSQCCGLGRLQFLSDPLASAAQRERRINEFVATGAKQLVTYCLSCTNAFQDMPPGLSSVHYLELLFNIRVDWPAVYASAQQALGPRPSHTPSGEGELTPCEL